MVPIWVAKIITDVRCGASGIQGRIALLRLTSTRTNALLVDYFISGKLNSDARQSTVSASQTLPLEAMSRHNGNEYWRPQRRLGLLRPRLARFSIKLRSLGTSHIHVHTDIHTFVSSYGWLMRPTRRAASFVVCCFTSFFVGHQCFAIAASAKLKLLLLGPNDFTGLSMLRCAADICRPLLLPLIRWQR